MSDGAGAVLFNTDEVEVQVKDGVATIANQAGFVGVGFDGSNYRFVRTNTSGQQVFVGAGVAGTPAGGVASVQGVSGGQALPISVASLPLPAGAATEGTLATRATETTLASRASEATLATLLTEAVFTTRIPVLGQKAMAGSIPVVLASDQSAIPITVASLPLPAGAATEATLTTRVAEATFTARVPTLGQKVMSASSPIVIASDQSPVRVRGKDAHGAAVTENPVLVAGWDTTNVRTLLMEPDGAVRTKDAFIDDRDKVVGVSYVKFAVAATTHFLLIDMSNTTTYPHANGTGGVFVAGANSKGVKSNSGASWAVSIFVIVRIDGTDADLVAIPGISFSLRDVSSLSVPEQILRFFPTMLDLTVAAGALVNVLSNFILLNQAAINTGITLEDAAGNPVAPAVGDVIIKADLVSGGGTLDFSVGLQYFVE